MNITPYRYCTGGWRLRLALLRYAVILGAAFTALFAVVQAGALDVDTPDLVSLSMTSDSVDVPLVLVDDGNADGVYSAVVGNDVAEVTLSAVAASGLTATLYERGEAGVADTGTFTLEEGHNSMLVDIEDGSTLVRTYYVDVERTGVSSMLVSNLERSPSSTRTVGDLTVEPGFRQEFTTGSNAAGYLLASVGLHVQSENFAQGETVTAAIYEQGALDGVVHGALVTELTTPDSFTDDAVASFSAVRGARLKPSTTYQLSLVFSGNSADDFSVSLTSIAAEEATSAVGWSIADRWRRDTGGTHTAGAARISVSGAALTPVPPPPPPPEVSFGEPEVSIRIGDGVGHAVDEDVGEMVFDVVLSEPVDRIVDVRYTVRNGTAVEGEDFTWEESPLSFAAGSTTTGIAIAIVNDGSVERRETFTIELIEVSHGAVLASNATITGVIVDDDALNVRLSHRTYQTTEDGGCVDAGLVFRATDPNAPIELFDPVVISYMTADITAVGGQDYIPLSGEVIVPAGVVGDLTAVISLCPIDDDLQEAPRETYSLQLVRPSTDSRIRLSLLDSAVSIADNDDWPAVSFGSAAVTVAEGRQGYVDVMLSHPSVYPIEVMVESVDGTASVSSGDYLAIDETVEVPPLTTTMRLSLEALADGESEPDETFTVQIRDVSHDFAIVDQPTIGTPDSVTVTIGRPAPVPRPQPVPEGGNGGGSDGHEESNDDEGTEEEGTEGEESDTDESTEEEGTEGEESDTDESTEEEGTEGEESDTDESTEETPVEGTVEISGPAFAAPGTEAVFEAVITGDLKNPVWEVTGPDDFNATADTERFAFVAEASGAYTVTVTLTSDDGEAAATTAVLKVFSDITDHRFANEIVWLAESGITVGCGPFAYCPDSPVTRGQMASFLTRALGLEVPDQSGGFVDVDPNSTHATDIEALYAAQITTGCQQNPLRYCPDSPVTRGQMASFLTRALGLEVPDQSGGFVDVDPNSTHATDIEALYAAQITTGCQQNPLRYCPDSPVTRGQMAAFLYRALVRGYR